MGTSTFGWVDFAEEDRRQMHDLIGLFRESDTVDELGIGTVRDAFANKFFPGTTTIQTRARYFLFVPWIYQRHEYKKTNSEKIAEKARNDEVALIEVLRNSDDLDGIIGFDARDALKRLASEVYWGGLRTWGILLFPGSRSEYHRWLDTYYRLSKNISRDDDGQLLDDRVKNNWHPGIPEAPSDLFSSVDISLTKKEAEYLQERVFTHYPESLLAFFLHQKKIPRKADYFWFLPKVQDVSEKLYIWIKHARNFSDSIYGAIILYNYMLATKRDNEEWIENHKDNFMNWADDNLMVNNLKNWDLNEMWSLFFEDKTNIGQQTRRFIESWVDICRDNQLKKIISSKTAHNIVKKREYQIKGPNKARLYNKRALEMWNGHSGDHRLDYRWQRPVRTMINDILKPLI